MFQFPRFPPMRYGFTHGCIGSSYAGLPIQRSSARRSCAPPRGLSQLITSFIGSQCQGIRPAPFLFDRPCPPVASGGRLAFPAAGWPPAARFVCYSMSFLSLTRAPSIWVWKVRRIYIVYAVFKVRCWLYSHQPSRCTVLHVPGSLVGIHPNLSLLSWRPPALPRDCAVPSAARALTFVFGMGTGMSPGRIATRNV